MHCKWPSTCGSVKRIWYSKLCGSSSMISCCKAKPEAVKSLFPSQARNLFVACFYCIKVQDPHHLSFQAGRKTKATSHKPTFAFRRHASHISVLCKVSCSERCHLIRKVASKSFPWRTTDLVAFSVFGLPFKCNPAIMGPIMIKRAYVWAIRSHIIA